MPVSPACNSLRFLSQREDQALRGRVSHIWGFESGWSRGGLQCIWPPCRLT